MTGIDGEPCRIRDVDRNSKILRDIPLLDRKLDSFTPEVNRGSVRQRHYSNYNTHQVCRDFPRASVSWVNEAIQQLQCNFGEYSRRFDFKSKIDEGESWFQVSNGIEDPFHGLYHKHGDSDSLIVRFKRNLPDFDGFWHMEDLLTWIDAIDDFFEEVSPPEHMKCKVVLYKMKGAAYYWWRRLQADRNEIGKEEIISWPRMKNLLLKRFLPAKCSTKRQNQRVEEEMEVLKDLKADKFTPNNRSTEFLFETDNDKPKGASDIEILDVSEVRYNDIGVETLKRATQIATDESEYEGPPSIKQHVGYTGIQVTLESDFGNLIPLQQQHLTLIVASDTSTAEEFIEHQYSKDDIDTIVVATTTTVNDVANTLEKSELQSHIISTSLYSDYGLMAGCWIKMNLRSAAGGVKQKLEHIIVYKGDLQPSIGATIPSYSPQSWNRGHIYDENMKKQTKGLDKEIQRSSRVPQTQLELIMGATSGTNISWEEGNFDGFYEHVVCPYLCVVKPICRFVPTSVDAYLTPFVKAYLYGFLSKFKEFHTISWCRLRNGTYQPLVLMSASSMLQPRTIEQRKLPYRLTGHTDLMYSVNFIMCNVNEILIEACWTREDHLTLLYHLPMVSIPMTLSFDPGGSPCSLETWGVFAFIVYADSFVLNITIDRKCDEHGLQPLNVGIISHILIPFDPGVIACFLIPWMSEFCGPALIELESKYGKKYLMPDEKNRNVALGITSQLAKEIRGVGEDLLSREGSFHRAFCDPFGILTSILWPFTITVSTVVALPSTLLLVLLKCCIIEDGVKKAIYTTLMVDHFLKYGSYFPGTKSIIDIGFVSSKELFFGSTKKVAALMVFQIPSKLENETTYNLATWLEKPMIFIIFFLDVIQMDTGPIRNDENNSNTFIMARQNVVTFFLCLSIVGKNVQSKRILKLFRKMVNGLDPPMDLDGELGRPRCGVHVLLPRGSTSMPMKWNSSADWQLSKTFNVAELSHFQAPDDATSHQVQLEDEFLVLGGDGDDAARYYSIFNYGLLIILLWFICCLNLVKSEN